MCPRIQPKSLADYPYICRLPVNLTEKSRRLHRLRRAIRLTQMSSDRVSIRMALRNLRNLRDLKNYTRPKLNLGGPSPDSDANREFHEKGLTQITQIRRFRADSSKRSHRLHGLHRCHTGGTLLDFHPDGICVIRVICETFPIIRVKPKCRCMKLLRKC